MKTSKYGEWLEAQGFSYPDGRSKEPGKPGLRYIDVNGFHAETDEAEPFMLVQYWPDRLEQHFAKLEDAAKTARAIGPRTHWQLLNGVTGEILLEPGLLMGHTTKDAEHRHEYIIGSNGKGTARMADGHEHKIENFKALDANGHSHELSLKSKDMRPE